MVTFQDILQHVDVSITLRFDETTDQFLFNRFDDGFVLRDYVLGSLFLQQFLEFLVDEFAPFVRTECVFRLSIFFENTYDLSDFRSRLGFDVSTPQFTRTDENFHDDLRSRKTSPGTSS